MGGLVGVVNGLVITRLKVVPFIATLGMLGVGAWCREVDGESADGQHAGTWLNELLVMFPNPAWLLVAPGVWIAIVLAVWLRSFCATRFLGGVCLRLARTKPRRARVVSPPID